MGEAYRFKFSRCGKDYSASWGIGFAFPNVYADTVKKIVAGEYGSEWKHIFESEKYVAVNADTYVYVCKRCGGWKADKDLSLYVPRDLNELKEKFKLDSIEELSEREWVMEWDLKEEYRLLRRRIHLCGKCKCAMHKSSDDERAKLVCPDCGGNPEEPGYCNMLNWD